MNIAVINVKDLFKYILKFLLVMILIILLRNGTKIIKQLSKTKEIINSKTSEIINKKMLKCIDSSSSIFSYNKNKSINFLECNKILAYGTTILNKNILENKKINSNENELNLNDEEKIKNEIISKNVTTENVSENNIIPKVTDSYKNVQIDNQSDYNITEEMLIPDVEITNKKNIIIYHTHTCESYTTSPDFEYEMTGNYRTTDLNYSVARVGTELTNYLQNKGFEVTHDTTYHDYPAYSGSYARSLATIQNIMLDKDADIVIDLHRDAIGSSNEYAPSIKVNGNKVAQLMFVIGSDGGGLEHPNWNQNLKIAVKIQAKANEMYPGLFRPIIIRNSRYNQHVAKGACIIEVGATGNKLEECILSMQCLANVLEEVCK